MYLICLVCLGRDSLNWPTTKGKLVSIDAKKRRPQSSFLLITVTYEYIVGEKKYVGSRISYLNEYMTSVDEIESDEFLNQIKQDNFNVYYFPKFPKISVIKPGFIDLSVTIFAIVTMIVTIVFLHFLYSVVGQFFDPSTLPPPRKWQ
jgi:hypothetical protein